MSTDRGVDVEDGFTLVEFLVAMMLLSMLSAVVSIGMIAGMRTSRQDASRNVALESAQTVLERLSRDIRVADPLRSPAATVTTPSTVGATTLTADVYRAGQCRRITWTASGAAAGSYTLTQKTYTWTSAAGSCPALGMTPTSTTTSTILSNLTSTSVFSYYDSSGNQLTDPAASAVRRVRITVTQTVPEQRAGTTTQTDVDLRNSH